MFGVEDGNVDQGCEVEFEVLHGRVVLDWRGFEVVETDCFQVAVLSAQQEDDLVNVLLTVFCGLRSLGTLLFSRHLLVHILPLRAELRLHAHNDSLNAIHLHML